MDRIKANKVWIVLRVDEPLCLDQCVAWSLRGTQLEDLGLLGLRQGILADPIRALKVSAAVTWVTRAPWFRSGFHTRTGPSATLRGLHSCIYSLQHPFSLSSSLPNHISALPLHAMASKRQTIGWESAQQDHWDELEGALGLVDLVDRATIDTGQAARQSA